MNREQFLKYVTDFSTLDKQSLEELKLIIKEFPHFQIAWILYAKNLYNVKDVRFKNKLKLAAIHVSDRKILKRIIEGVEPKAAISSKEIIKPIIESTNEEVKKESLTKDEVQQKEKILTNKQNFYNKHIKLCLKHVKIN